MANHNFAAMYNRAIYIIKRISCFLLLLLPLFSSAQISDVRFRHISNEQGLSNSTVNCIFQDSRGFMWFGTRDGLNRYDGVTINIYKTNPKDVSSISDNFIRCIYEDVNHKIWIGTSYGLNCFDPVTDKFTRFKNDAVGDAVTAVYGLSDNELLVGTLGKGLELLNTQTGNVKHYKNEAKNPNSLSCDTVNFIYRDSYKNIWIGTQGGLNEFDANKFTFKLYGANTNAVVAVTEDKANNLWLGTSDAGLLVFNPAANTFKAFKHSETDANSLSGDLILSLLTDKNGNIYIGTINEGMNFYDVKKNKFYRYYPKPDNAGSLSNTTVSALLEDNQGDLWIGTHRGGVNQYTHDIDKFKLFRQGIDNASLSYNDVKAFFQDSKGNIWVGTDGGGLNLFDRKTATFKHYKNTANDPHSLSSNAIQCIGEDAKGNIWVGTWGEGVNLLDPKTGKCIRFKNDPKDKNSISSNFLQMMHLDKKGNFWVATYGGGLNMLNAQTHQFTRVTKDPDGVTELHGKDIVSIGEDLDHNLWFGTDDGGLNRYDLNTYRFSHYFEDGGKKTDSRVIFTDSKGQVWIGMAGLYLFNKQQNKFNLFTNKAGLGSLFIKGITEGNKGNLWISTSSGLIKLNPATRQTQLFNTWDGLQGMEFEANSYLKTSNGEMFFGGERGFNSFFPDDIKTNTFVPPVYITNFQLFNKDVKPGDKDSLLKTDVSYSDRLLLEYTQSSISFSFTALNYIITRNNQYYYKLDGLDKDWVKAGTERKASYTNLDPGTYTFRVKGSNNDGIWNDKGASITISIDPPFWQTAWFRVLMLLVIIQALYWFYRYKMSAVERQKIELARQVRERTNELSTKARELQIKSDELQEANEEMQVQSEELLSQSEELLSQSEHLRDLNHELIAQKKQEQLAREDAENANQAKSVFFGYNEPRDKNTDEWRNRYGFAFIRNPTRQRAA